MASDNDDVNVGEYVHGEVLLSSDGFSSTINGLVNLLEFLERGTLEEVTIDYLRSEAVRLISVIISKEIKNYV